VAKSFFQRHFERVQAALNPALQAATIATWLCLNTTLKGKPFSFKDHEYQKVILDSPAQVKNVKKCSQIGISELAVRRLIAKVMLHAAINAMYVLPTAAFSALFAATRLAPALDSSKVAKEALYRTDSRFRCLLVI